MHLLGQLLTAPPPAVLPAFGETIRSSDPPPPSSRIFFPSRYLSSRDATADSPTPSSRQAFPPPSGRTRPISPLLRGNLDAPHGPLPGRTCQHLNLSLKSNGLWVCPLQSRCPTLSPPFCKKVPTFDLFPFPPAPLFLDPKI